MKKADPGSYSAVVWSIALRRQLRLMSGHSGVVAALLVSRDAAFPGLLTGQERPVLVILGTHA